jgi:membrane associated rhomboid family serine protease
VIPIRDYLPTRRPALVNGTLMALNVLAYVYLFGFTFSPSPRDFVNVLPLMMVPADIAQGANLHSLITSMFLHANLLHLGGNMLFLYIFGNNVEDHLGHLRYLVFYLACGIAAGLAQAAVDPASTVPSLGASGAIAGVLAAYLVLYPAAEVETVVLLGCLPLFFRLPAIIVIGLWVVIQFVSGYEQLGATHSLEHGGVGYWAHIGGFAAGLALIALMRRRRETAWR